MKQHRRLAKIAAAIAVATMGTIACNNEHKPAAQSTPAVDSSALAVPASISYDIINQYPHDPSAFTEGLEFKDGILYESTGLRGVSDIRKTDLKTGKIITATKMEDRYFGEGMTMLNGKIYQLTYKEGKGFVYDANTLKQLSTFTFDAPEGWGMTNNGYHLIFDDGTNTLHYVDPNTFKEVKRLAVKDEHGPVNEINELEMIHGYIYANQWQTDLILKIDTTSGMVVGRADLSSIHERTGIPGVSGVKGEPDVFNGIAYDAASNRIFVTGKNWPKVLEIKLDN